MIDGHRRQVLDVDLDQPVVPARPVGELLQVDRRRDPERERQKAV